MVAFNECNNLEQYMDSYGSLLGEQASRSVAPLHVPGKDDTIDLSEFLRTPYGAQAHCATAIVKALDRQKTVMMVAECGTGKTITSIVACHSHAKGKPYRAIVMVPPHLVGKWCREVDSTIAGAKIRAIKTYKDVTPLLGADKPEVPEWYIISQSSAKLGTTWRAAFATKKRSIGIPFCPSCGHAVMKMDKQTKLQVPVSPKFLGKSKTDCSNCLEPLWQWERNIDRWPVATYVHKHLKGTFDYFVVDEAHEMKGDTTARANAMGSLAAASKKVITLTGTMIGGYADHLRTMLFRLCPSTLVEENIRWRDRMLFNERYGRIETVTYEKGSSGSSDDNAMSKGRQVSCRRSVKPGVMPTIMRHVIGQCVFLTLDEVAEHLPEFDEDVITVDMDQEQTAEYNRIEEHLTEAMKKMLSRGDRRLMGAMLHTLLAYPDHPYDFDTIGYTETSPTSANEIFVPVVTPESLDRTTVRPKEARLVKEVLAEHANGRQVWVFTTMTTKRDVAARLEKLFKDAGLTVKVLRSSVDTKHREEWIAKNGAGADVIISHPQLVQTGLDLFDKEYYAKAPGTSHNFVSLFFYMTGYNLFTLRQASRRAWRIGQLEKCKVRYFFYSNTMQARAMTLMGTKLTAAESIEGRFSEEGLAAMSGDDASIEVALARSLVNKMDDLDAVRAWEKVTQTKKGNIGLSKWAILCPMTEVQSMPKREIIQLSILGDGKGEYA